MDTFLGFLHSGFNTIIPFIILLGILIFVHELGHFAVAKWCGVRVEVFSLGFGKKILQHKRGDTIYCISLIPLGGYVKMFGDELGAKLTTEDKKYSFIHKNVWQRIAIVLAGPMMNFFFAILIFALLSWTGEEFRKPIVGDISKNSKAFTSGLRSGDEIVRADGRNVKTWDDLVDVLTLQSGRNVLLEVLRPNTEGLIQVSLVPQLKANPNLLSTKSEVGDVEGLTFISRSSVVGVRGSSLAEKMGFKTGDRVLKVGTVEVKHFRDIENLILPLQGTTLSFEVERFISKDKTETVAFEAKVPTHSSLQGLGIENPELFLMEVVPDSPADKAGLKRGDRLVAINEKKLNAFEDTLNTVKSYTGESPLNFEIERDGAPVKFEIVPTMSKLMSGQGVEEKRYTIGIIPWITYASPTLTKIQWSGIETLERGLDRTLEVSAMTIMGFLRLIQNKISPKNIGGVISIGQAASETFKIGWFQFLTMMAIVSVNLFILNLLPIPVLDGGHLLFYTIEALRGAPLSMRKLEVAQQVGLVVLMSLMVFALFNDFSRIFGFW